MPSRFSFIAGARRVSGRVHNLGPSGSERLNCAFRRILLRVLAGTIVPSVSEVQSTIWESKALFSGREQCNIIVTKEKSI